MWLHHLFVVLEVNPTDFIRFQLQVFRQTNQKLVVRIRREWPVCNRFCIRSLNINYLENRKKIDFDYWLSLQPAMTTSPGRREIKFLLPMHMSSDTCFKSIRPNGFKSVSVSCHWIIPFENNLKTASFHLLASNPLYTNTKPDENLHQLPTRQKSNGTVGSIVVFRTWANSYDP